MANLKPREDGNVYQLKVTLKYLRPPIWRRLQVSNNVTLQKLRNILQDAMGWYGGHLHQFTIQGANYGEPDPQYEGMGMEMKNEKRFRLDQVVSAPKSKFIYEYDFGDSWMHEILVEKILPPEKGIRSPVCLAGARACPPEDCGGVGGYANLLEAINDPGHPEHEDLLEWVGGGFDPEAFDLVHINARMGALR